MCGDIRKYRTVKSLRSIAIYAMLASMTTDAIIPMGGAEACDLLDVSRDTLIRMIARGVIKGHKLAGDKGQWIVDRLEIERLAAEKSEATA